jgi:alanyl-tRNA synthetase
LLGAKEPLMHRSGQQPVPPKWVRPTPNCLRAQPLIEATLLQEETQFRRTLDKGTEAAGRGNRGHGVKGDILAGDTAFKLYDTFGFPYDLTEDALRAQGFGIDQAGGFETAMGEQKATRPRRLERQLAPRPPTMCGSTLPSAPARPSSPATPQAKAKAKLWRLVNDGVEVQSAALPATR